MRRFQQVDRLLHDAEHADSGAAFARHMAGMQPHNRQHRQAAEELAAKRDRLLAEALALDPERTAPAWEETTLTIPEAR